MNTTQRVFRQSLTTVMIGAGIMLLSALSGMPVLAAPDMQPETTPGSLSVISDNSNILDVPLTHTEVNAEISGMIAYVEVQQTFHNPYNERIEAVYVFPLPNMAAVNEMIMKVGDRLIYSEVHERDKAQQIYIEAREAGQHASLLEQERPNIFTQSVANIMPGEDIVIVIRYVQDLPYKDGQYEFVFPTVVGPRYIPGEAIDIQSGTGWSPDTSAVPDASRITPPVIPPTFRSGHDINITLNINGGLPIQSYTVPTHMTYDERISKTHVRITLASNDRIPNKDFIVRYTVNDSKPNAAFISYKEENAADGYFMLMLQPQLKIKTRDIRPKEMIFVVDCSGSMSGEPMAKAKAAMRRAINNLNPNDTFQIIKFSDAANGFAPAPVANTAQNIMNARRFINEMHGTGGTQMIEGIKAALDYPHDENRLRIVLFMTDGYIGDERQIFAAIKKKIGDTRLFSFGVGSSVNRYLLDNMAKTGRGDVFYCTLNEETKPQINRFYDRVRNPVLTDIAIQWNGLKVYDTIPKYIPDLFSSTPLQICGRYSKPGNTTITITGMAGTTPFVKKMHITLPKKAPENKVISLLWARKRIAEIMSSMYSEGSDKEKSEIISLAKTYHLMSKYTSMVAVEREIIADITVPLNKIAIPVEMPDGVSYEGVFGKPIINGQTQKQSAGSNMEEDEYVRPLMGRATAGKKASIPMNAYTANPSITNSANNEKIHGLYSDAVISSVTVNETILSVNAPKTARDVHIIMTLNSMYIRSQCIWDETNTVWKTIIKTDIITAAGKLTADIVITDSTGIKKKTTLTFKTTGNKHPIISVQRKNKKSPFILTATIPVLKKSHGGISAELVIQPKTISIHTDDQMQYFAYDRQTGTWNCEINKHIASLSTIPCETSYWNMPLHRQTISLHR